LQSTAQQRTVPFKVARARLDDTSSSAATWRACWRPEASSAHDMSDTLANFQSTQPVAFGMLVLSSAIAGGLALGSLRYRGIGLGVAGVLFAGIALGHFKLTPNLDVLSFVREFGLVLFVFGIGVQVGPGFITSLRQRGLPLNLIAAAIVVSGALMVALLGPLFAVAPAAAVGVFAGATTNTPALAAAQEALRGMDTTTPEVLALPALGYAAAYPFGVLGIIVTLLGLRAALRIHLDDEAAVFAAQQRRGSEPVSRMSIVVDNDNLSGMQLSLVPGMHELGVVVSRVRPFGSHEVNPARLDTVLQRGDTLLVVGPSSSLAKFCTIVGKRAADDLAIAPGSLKSERVIVTNKGVLGKTLEQLALRAHFGVTVTRVHRAEVELTARSSFRVAFGDVLQMVGEPQGLKQASAQLGNSMRDMNLTNLLPIFLGIGLGVLVGSYPISLPGIPSPVKLGLAGGPLLVAILLSRIGKIGPLVWYIPPSANAALRELGIVLFLACVGLKAGEHFVPLVLSGDGMRLMLMGTLITLVPIVVFGLVARYLLRVDFLTLSGLLAGSMTDPPALAFATAVTRSDAPSLAYATVYPLTMLLRILAAQLLVMLTGS
jgi:putative transport protein